MNFDWLLGYKILRPEPIPVAYGTIKVKAATLDLDRLAHTHFEPGGWQVYTGGRLFGYFAERVVLLEDHEAEYTWMEKIDDDRARKRRLEFKVIKRQYFHSNADLARFGRQHLGQMLGANHVPTSASAYECPLQDGKIWAWKALSMEPECMELLFDLDSFEPV